MSTISFEQDQEIVIVDALGNSYTGTAPFTKEPFTYINGKEVDSVLFLGLVNKDFSIEIDKDDFIKDVKGNLFFKISGPRPTNIRKRGK